MLLYSNDKTTYREVTADEINEGLENGTIIKELIKVAEEEKRPYKSRETIYNELKAAGENVKIKNNIYCKVVNGTLEAINEQTLIDDYEIYKEA